MACRPCRRFFSTSSKQFIILLLLYTTWIFVGGIIFIQIEEGCQWKPTVEREMADAPIDDIMLSRSLCEQIKDVLLPYLSRKSLISDSAPLGENEKNLSRNSLPLVIMKNLSDIVKKCPILRNKNMTPQPDLVSINGSSDDQIDKCKKWNLQNLIKWVAFSSSTVFTIGYGDPTPKTSTGMTVMILYALIGMPIALAMLGVGGQLVIDNLFRLIEAFEGKCFGRRKISEESSHDHIKVLFAAFVSFVFSIIGGCVITTNFHLSDRPWTVSIYYWFQTITTIGYGDITSKRGTYDGWRVIILVPYTMFVILGLALMSALLNLVATILITGEWRRYTCCNSVTSEDDVIVIKMEEKECKDEEVVKLKEGFNEMESKDIEEEKMIQSEPQSNDIV